MSWETRFDTKLALVIREPIHYLKTPASRPRILISSNSRSKVKPSKPIAWLSIQTDYLGVRTHESNSITGNDRLTFFE